MTLPEPQDLVPTTLTPPAEIKPLSVDQMRAEVRHYRALQKMLDEEMPEQIMEIGKGQNAKKYRKKGYWRAVKKQARVNLELVREEYIVRDWPIADDWGYSITYRAIAPNGEYMDGDGTCMASEKKDRQGNIIATEHNVRSHAHTRAKNRAISDLVGFGEVSAEEFIDDHAKPEKPKEKPPELLTKKEIAHVTDLLMKIHHLDPSFNIERFYQDYLHGKTLEQVQVTQLGKILEALNKRLEQAKAINAAQDDANAHTQQQQDETTDETQSDLAGDRG